MAASARTHLESGLEERLGRLSGDDNAWVVPDYAGLAEKVRVSPRFSDALARAKALSDEHRLLTVALLKRRAELCACEIQAATGLTHATVSHHMGLLLDAGIVHARKEGKWLYYRLARTTEVQIP
ncbi:MAG: ArsR/SmtB family transcription factor [Thermoplasmata archaeon]